MAGEIVLYDPMGVQVNLENNEPADAPIFKTMPEGIPGSVQDRYREYVSYNLSPGKIAEVTREADNGEPLRLILLTEELLEKDPKLKSVAGTRKRAVKGLYWDVSPCELDEYADAADVAQADDIAKACSRAMRASNFDELLGNLLTAITKPFAISWITWIRDYQGYVVPQFDTIPATHVRWSFSKDEIRFFDPTKPMVSGIGGDAGIVAPKWSTVRALYNPDEDHPTRGGLGRTVLMYELFKSIAIKDLVALCERHGMPIRTLKVPDQFFNDEEVRAVYRQSLRDLGTDGSAVISDQTELMLTEMVRSGVDPFAAVIELTDRMIAQLYLGHELSSQSSPGSGQLGISAALEVLQSVVQDDCQWVSAIVKRDVLRPLVGFNFGWELERLTPELYFDWEPEADLLAAARVDTLIAKTFPDMPWSMQQMRDKYGVEAPLDNDPEDALYPSKAPAPQPPTETPPGEEIAPQEPPESEKEGIPGETIPTVQAVYKRKRRRGPGKYRPGQQRKVDRLARRGIDRSGAVLEEWRKQLRARIRQAVKDGDVVAVRRAIVKSFPELDVKDLEREIHDQTVLARLFGRNG